MDQSEMSPEQQQAIRCAAIDLAYAVRCRRDCEPMEVTPLLDTLDDLRAAFPDIGLLDTLVQELEEEQA